MQARYVPNGQDEHVDEPQEPLGPEKNQLPIDRNVTFTFDYEQGKLSPEAYVQYSSDLNNFRYN